jgi:hypothetical protein
MGTRADFYVGRGKKAKWLGSIAWDGYPGGLPKSLLMAKQSEEHFRMEVAKELATRGDATFPEMGWPWPWNDSHTTDYAYAFEDGKVWTSCFGCEWVDPLLSDKELNDAIDNAKEKAAIFPDMLGIKNVNWGKRSGIIIVGPKGVEN